MIFAKRVFLLAGIYGLITLAPMLFIEGRIATDSPPAITHPEFFYGFLLVALVFQLVFLVMSRDPVRYRNLMPVAMIEKFPFGLAVLVLFLQGRTSGSVLGFASIDIVWGILFAVAYARTPRGI